MMDPYSSSDQRWESSNPMNASDYIPYETMLSREHLAKTLDEAMADEPVVTDQSLEDGELSDRKLLNSAQNPPAPTSASNSIEWLQDLFVSSPRTTAPTFPFVEQPEAPTQGPTIENSQLNMSESCKDHDWPSPQQQDQQLRLCSIEDPFKPMDALGQMCVAGFYLVSLTRCFIRNPSVPCDVRATFLAPQLHFGFTVKGERGSEWRHIPAKKLPFESLQSAGKWLCNRLGVPLDEDSFKTIKDMLQKKVAEAWSGERWYLLEAALSDNFDNVSAADLTAALASNAISGTVKCTPREYFLQVNCHKNASDIRHDVDGAVSALESLRAILADLNLNPEGSNIPVATFRKTVFPLWRHHCQYVRDHSEEGCCQFYDGGYFKQIMIHKHLYNVGSCSSAYHVKDLFEGLNCVIKIWTNPTGMCVREAKCAAGLRYNVDKSFQSGIRGYSKAKFLEEAPHKARGLLKLERQLHKYVQALLQQKQKAFPKCRRALHEVEMQTADLAKRQLPDELQAGLLELSIGPQLPSVTRRRRRAEKDNVAAPFTPREQKRKHAHLSLKRKEAEEKRIRLYLEQLREDCFEQERFLERIGRHGESCGCFETNPIMIFDRLYPTSANVPVA